MKPESAEKFVMPAQERDLEEISYLVNSAYRGESSRAGWTTEADLLGGDRIDPKILLEEFRQPDRTLLCLRESQGNSILGCVSLERREGERGIYYHLGMLTIRPRIQTQGFGKILMSEAEKFAKARGATWMELSVIHKRAELTAWYERRGYRKTGKTESFFDDAIRFPRLTSEPLYFVKMEKLL